MTGPDEPEVPDSATSVDATSSSLGAGPCLIEHANRCWDAERENASRILSRRRAVATAIVVVLGLGLYKVEWYRGKDEIAILGNIFIVWTVKILLLVAIALFARALAVLFWPKQRRSDMGGIAPKQTASHKLAFTPSDKNRSPDLAVMRRTYSAYLQLRSQNAEEWDKIRRGERAAGGAVACIFAAFGLYVFFAVPPIIKPEVSDDSNRQRIEAEGDFSGAIDLRFGRDVEPQPQGDQAVPSEP